VKKKGEKCNQTKMAFVALEDNNTSSSIYLSNEYKKVNLCLMTYCKTFINVNISNFKVDSKEAQLLNA